jgi:hypothetical protein
MRLRLLLLAAFLGLTALFAAPRAAAQPDLTGTWAGALDLGGAELRIVFHVDSTDGGLTATMDSPDQGATGIPVSGVRATPDSLTLDVAAIGGRYRGAIGPRARRLEGEWMQSGRSFPLTLTPAEAADTAAATRARPQHPEPPYPYAVDSVRFGNPEAGLALAGTLTRPDAPGPHPGVVLVSGSGPQDRNSTVAGHRLFHVLADRLTRSGVAVLRYDERGVGASEGRFAGATARDLAGDAAAAVRALKGRPEVADGKVGLVGMSEGGYVAPMVHVRRAPVDFLVLMAGPSVPGGDVLVEQVAGIAEARGASPAQVDSVRALQRRVMEAVQAPGDSVAAAGRVREVLEAEGLSGRAVDAQVESVTSPWFRHFVRHDPAEVLRQVDVPVLALYGSNDLQVPPAQNAAPMRRALEASPDATVRVLDGLNHLFQPADTGLPSRYATIDTTMAPAALDAVAQWIGARTGGP